MIPFGSFMSVESMISLKMKKDSFLQKMQMEILTLLTVEIFQLNGPVVLGSRPNHRLHFRPEKRSNMCVGSNPSTSDSFQKKPTFGKTLLKAHMYNTL